MIGQTISHYRVIEKLGGGGDHDVYLAKWDGTQPHKLVTVAGYPFAPTFSPDANHLRFSVRAQDAVSFSLWEVAVDGTGLHSLASGELSPRPR
jgi:Tol biopolymer transport system component